MQSVYKIGLEIVAKNNVGPAFRLIMRDLVGMGKQADLLVGKWGKLRIAAIGAGAAMAGIGVLRGLARMVELSDKLYRNELRLRQMGMSVPGSRSVTQAALRAQMQTPSVGAADAVGVAGKLYTTFGTSARVKAALPAAVRAEAVLDNMGIGGNRSFGNLVKAIEISGGAFKRVNGKEEFSVSRFKRALDLFLRAQDVTGGLLTSAQIYQATKMAGPAAGLEGLRAYVDTMAEAVQQMGPRGGRGMNMVYKQFQGGMMGRTYLMNLERLGLVRSGGVQWFQGSSQGNIKPGALLGNDVLNKQGLLAWVTKVLVPDLAKHGMHTLKQQIAGVYQIFGAVTAQALVANMIQNQPAYERTAQMIAKAPGASGILASQMRGEGASLHALKNAWQSFLEVAGLPLIKPAVRMIHELTGVIIRMETWAIAHPKAMESIDKGLAALGVALLTLGSAAVIGALASLAGPGGLLLALAGGITALAASFNMMPPWLLRAMIGGVAGGVVGSVVPGAGTAAGALAGAVGGALWGLNPQQKTSNPLGAVPSGATTQHQMANFLASMPSHSGHGGAVSAPVPVVVVNGKDIAAGVTKHQASGLQRNPSGPVGHNLRQGYLQPAYPAPGL